MRVTQVALYKKKKRFRKNIAFRSDIYDIMAEIRQPSSDPIRQLIINSLFPEMTEEPSQGNSFASESFIIHLKVSEDSTGTRPPTINERTAFRVERKSRYLLVSSTERWQNIPSQVKKKFK